MATNFIPVSGIDSVQPKPPTSAAWSGQTMNVGPLDATADFNGVSEAFRGFIENFQSSSANYAKVVGTSGGDPVEAAKQDLAPQLDPSEGGSLTARTADESFKVLNQSFDHAIFVTLVSQVVGGVSQATSTLIRQS
jgi:hypothetical protein